MLASESRYQVGVQPREFSRERGCPCYRLHQASGKMRVECLALEHWRCAKEQPVVHGSRAPQENIHGIFRGWGVGPNKRREVCTESLRAEQLCEEPGGLRIPSIFTR